MMKTKTQTITMLIHCVGDSHANFFSGYDEPQPEWPGNNIANRYPFFGCYRLGPVLAYNLCQENSTTRGREKLFELLSGLEPGSYLLFCFGEIDCRAHIYLQAKKQGKSTDNVAADVVERYFQVIREIRQQGFQPLVWNVLPSAPSDINDRILVPSQYLFHGSRGQRNRITRRFNQLLQEHCQRFQVPFLSIFDELIDTDGAVKKEYFCDEIHLGQVAMPLVLEKFRLLFPDCDTFDQ